MTGGLTFAPPAAFVFNLSIDKIHRPATSENPSVAIPKYNPRILNAGIPTIRATRIPHKTPIPSARK